MTLANDERILDCGHKPSPHSEHTTGTAHTQDGQEICWQCAADNDRKAMIESGRSRTLPLYLTGIPVAHMKANGEPLTVSNWPVTLKFPVIRYRKGNHNIGGVRWDVWFDGPDGFVWHGVQIGEWNQVCHCRRTKQRVG